MSHQDHDQVGTDLGLGVEFSDPEINQDISSPIRVVTSEQVCSEFVFVVRGGVSWVFMNFREPYACFIHYIYNFEAW